MQPIPKNTEHFQGSKMLTPKVIPLAGGDLPIVTQQAEAGQGMF